MISETGKRFFRSAGGRLLCSLLLGAVVLWWSDEGPALAADHHQSHDEEGAAEESEKDGPLVFELQLGKKEEPSFTLKPGRYRVSHKVEASGGYLAEVTLIEQEGGIKRIPLIDRVSREAKAAEFSGDTTFIFRGRYELQYRLRGGDISGEIMFERIEEPPAEGGLFAGMYVGVVERDDQVSTLPRTKTGLREQRVSLVVRQSDSGVRVEHDGVMLEKVSVKGSVLIGSISQPSYPTEGEGACQEERTVILQKKQKASGQLRVFSRHLCPDGSFCGRPSRERCCAGNL